MPPISDYYTSAGLNVGLFPEGMQPGAVNDGMRAIQADLRALVNDLPWINYGNGSGPPVYTYVSGTSFSVTGDVAAIYNQHRRVRAVGATTGTIYGRIQSGTHNAGTTTVVVVWDSGSLANETLTISLWVPVTGTRDARLDRTQTFLSPNTFSTDVTFSGDVYINGTLYKNGVPEDPPEFGSAAVKNTGTSGDTIPLLNTSATWTNGTTQTFGNINVLGTFKLSGITYTFGTASSYDIGNSGAKVPLCNASNTWGGTQTVNTLNATTLQVGGVSRNSASTTVAGLVELATDAEARQGLSSSVVLTPSNLGNNILFANPGYIRYFGALIQFGSVVTNGSGVATVTYATPFLQSAAPVCNAFRSGFSTVSITSSLVGSFSILTSDSLGNPLPSLTVTWISIGY